MTPPPGTLVARLVSWTLIITTLEVWFTATIERLTAPNFVLSEVPAASLQGRSSIYQVGFGFTLATALPLLLGIYDGLPNGFRNTYVEAAVFMVAIYVLEFGSGMILNRWLKLQLWDYSYHMLPGTKIPFNLLGQISGYYAPGWYLAGLVLRPLNSAMDHLDPWLNETAVEFWREFTRRL